MKLLAINKLNTSFTNKVLILLLGQTLRQNLGEFRIFVNNI